MANGTPETEALQNPYDPSDNGDPQNTNPPPQYTNYLQAMLTWPAQEKQTVQPDKWPRSCFIRPENGTTQGPFSPLYGTNQDFVNNTSAGNLLTLTSGSNATGPTFAMAHARTGHRITQQDNSTTHISTVTVTDPEGIVTLTADVDTATGQASRVVIGSDYYFRDLDEHHRIRRLIRARHVGDQYKIQEIIYTKYTDAVVTGGPDYLKRARKTTVTWNSDGTARCVTEIHGYYDNNSASNSLNFKYAVDADGVSRFLKAYPQATGISTENLPTDAAGAVADNEGPLQDCGLDNSTYADAHLGEYANVAVSSYDQLGRVTSISIGSSCGSCSHGEGEGITEYSFNEEPGNGTIYTSYGDINYAGVNGWTYYKKITHPDTRRRTVEFYNYLRQVVYRVEQDTSCTPRRSWITHFVYSVDPGRLGTIAEIRYPSACTGYSLSTPLLDPQHEEWPINVTPQDGTTGLVKFYTYDQTTGMLMTEGVREGTTINTAKTHVLRTYEYDQLGTTTVDNSTVNRVTKQTEYLDSGNVETNYSYTFYPYSHAVETKTVTYPTVDLTTENGSSSATSVVYHYARDTEYGVYYADWIKHEDGTYTHTEHNDYDQVTSVTRDVSTSPPMGWPAHENGTNLTTTYTYDDWGRVATVTNPASKLTWYWYTCTYDHVRGAGTTTRLVTLTAPHKAGNEYGFFPMSIDVTDLNGRTIVSAEGAPSTHNDGDPSDDWNPDWTEGTTYLAGGANPGFRGTLTSRTDYIYNVGHLQEVRRYRNPTAASDGSLGTDYYRTFYKYDHGRREYVIEVMSGTSTTTNVQRVTKTLYDCRDSVTEVQQGVTTANLDLISQGDYGNVGSPTLVTLHTISETFYDEVGGGTPGPMPGSGTSGVGEGGVTQTRQYYAQGSYYQTVYNHDFRDRVTARRGPDQVATTYAYDNQDRLTFQQTYVESTLTNGTIGTADNKRRAAFQTDYDKKGQVFRELVYAVNASTGGDGTSIMTTDYWRDETGRITKVKGPDPATGTAAGFRKTIYNGAGQVLYEATCGSEGTGETYGWTLTDDVILDLTAYQYTNGRLVAVWQGTQLGSSPLPTSPNDGTTVGNMVKVAKVFYDENGDDTSTTDRHRETGRAWLRAVDNPADPGAFAVVKYLYWIDGRRVAVILPDPAGGGTFETKIAKTFDGLGRVKITTKFKKVGETVTGLACTENVYGNSVHLEGAKVYEKNVDGTFTHYLQTLYDYDGYGNLIRELKPSGALTKASYDNYGRLTGVYLCSTEGSGQNPNTSPANLTDDVVVEQTVPSYDALGRVWLVSRFSRRHNATGTGPLNALGGSQPLARVTYTVTWFDTLNRKTKVVYYGDNSGVVISDRVNSDFDPETGTAAYAAGGPATNYSTKCDVTVLDYDDYSRVYQVTDNAGRKTKMLFDGAGRKTHVIENWIDFQLASGVDTGSGPGTADRVTKFVYNVAGQVTKQIALHPGGDDNLSDNQETRYVYSNELADKGCPVPSNTLLRAVIYPDSTDTVTNNALSPAAPSGDRTEIAYFANGARKTLTDQRQVAHSYVYDDYVRLTADKVTLPQNATVDGSVLRIDRSYDPNGLTDTVTSYDSATELTSGHVVNQIKYAHDGWGQVTKSIQKHSGEAGANDPAVQYAYDFGLAGNVASHARLDTLAYPNGRAVKYAYGTTDGIDDRFSRVRGTTDSTATTTFAQYTYLGAGTFVQVEHPAVTNGQVLTYDPAGNASYAGMDSLGRVTRHLWQTGQTTPTPIFDIGHGYDLASNRTYARQDTYRGSSEFYAYDELNRLTSYKFGQATTASGPVSDISSYWRTREQGWTLNSVGDQTAVKDFGQSDWYQGTFNSANEFVDAAASRKVMATSAKRYLVDDSFNADTSSNYHLPDGSNDVLSVSGGNLVAQTVVADTYGPTGDQHTEDEPRLVATVGEPISGAFLFACVRFPTGSCGTNSDYAGVVFGYKGPNDYWMVVLEALPNQNDVRRVYHVQNGAKTPVCESALGYELQPNTTYYIVEDIRRDCLAVSGYSFSGAGIPSGKIGLVTNVQGMKFESLQVSDDARPADLLGRWIGGTPDTHAVGGQLYLGGHGCQNNVPFVLRNVRLKDFRATFRVHRDASSTFAYGDFVFNARDPHWYNHVMLYHATAGYAPSAYKVVNGGLSAYASPTVSNGSQVPAAASDTTNLWYRVTCSNGTVTINALVNDDADGPTDTAWGQAGICYQTTDVPTDGGLIGFIHGNIYIDNLTIEGQDNSQWVKQAVERFTINGNYAEHRPAYDPAGNCTFDGLYRYTYDAWGRMAQAIRGWRDDDGTLNSGSVVATMKYDGLHRRTTKLVTNSGDWSNGASGMTYEYYWDENWRMLETRNGSDQTLTQHLWGARYVDDLVQIAVNTNLTGGNTCGTAYYALQNANYNVIGLTDSAGTLVERYEYAPYGQRTVYKKGGTNDELTSAPLYDSQPVLIGGQPAPYGLCDIGHQGLTYDKEFGLYYNRYRYLDPRTGRMMQRDPLEFVGGMGLYTYASAAPTEYVDWSGDEPTPNVAVDGHTCKTPLPKKSDYNDEKEWQGVFNTVASIRSHCPECQAAADSAATAGTTQDAPVASKPAPPAKPLPDVRCEVVVFWGDEGDFPKEMNTPLTEWDNSQDKAKSTRCAAGALACKTDGTNTGPYNGQYAITGFPNCSEGKLGHVPGDLNAGYNPAPETVPMKAGEKKEDYQYRRRLAAKGFVALLADAWQKAVQQGAEFAKDCQCRCKGDKVTVRFRATESRQGPEGANTIPGRLDIAGEKPGQTSTIIAGEPPKNVTYPKFPTNGTQVEFDCVKGRHPSGTPAGRK